MSSNQPLIIAVVIVLIIIVLWIWWFQYNHPATDSMYLDTLMNGGMLKTGDIILFKATDNWNAPQILCYYSHIGVVICTPAGPMLFEAAGTKGMDLKPGQNKAGIFLVPLRQRLEKYKGRIYYKELNRAAPLTERVVEFIEYALDNMEYEYSVAKSCFAKGLGLAKCGNKTNCGEITMLTLIALGVLAESEYDRVRPHHLRDMCEFTRGINGYKYYKPVRILVDPF